MGPITGVCFGVVTGNWGQARRALRTELVGMFVAIMVGFVSGLLLFSLNTEDGLSL